MDESCQSLLSHSDISYDRTEDDVVRSVQLQVSGFTPIVRGSFALTSAVAQPLCISMVRGGLLSELEINVGDAPGLMQPQTPCCLSGC